MSRTTLILAVTFLATCLAAPDAAAQGRPGMGDMDGGQVFELRTYTTHPGRLDALTRRFRDHTTRLFEKHGMVNIGYWVAQDEPLSENTLIYVLSYPSREAATEAWEAFRADPEWRRVSEESQRDGPIVESVESVFMDPTDFSAIK